MHRQRLSDAGEPRVSRSQRSDAVAEAVKCLCFVVLLLLMTLLIVWGVRGFGLEPSSVSTPPTLPSMGSSASPSAATFPVEMVQAAIAISTSLAPTPTATATAIPTPPIATLFCGIDARTGMSCVWPEPTIMPTPEPTLPPCQTPMPEASCLWTGNRMGTPTTIETVTAERGS